MKTPLTAKRLTCDVCLRPQSACICRWITPVAHQTEVLILQHPLEVDHAKNSARLLHLSLPESRIVTGEAFDERHLGPGLDTGKYTVLLYPRSARALHEPATSLDIERLKEPARLRLVVLDATWRKSRKMLHLSPILQGMPRLSLDDAPASSYSIRKAHQPGQLSTLEATCFALMRLEPRPEKFHHLLDAFKGFVAQQLAFRPT
jgi:DTW domain-containing protein YfiP